MQKDFYLFSVTGKIQSYSVTLFRQNYHFKALITKTLLKNLLPDSDKEKEVLITGERHFKKFVQLKVELGQGFFSGGPK